MKRDQIKVGGHYTAKVSGNLVTVRVDAIDNKPSPGIYSTKVAYHVTNLATGRKTTFRSAQKFRGPAKVQPALKIARPEDRGGEQCSDPTSGPATSAAATTPTASASPRTATPTQTSKASEPTSDGATGSNGSTPLARLLQASVNHEQAKQAPHLIVVARAGTGKTTTLVEGLKRVKGLPTSITPSPQQAAVWEQMELSRGAGSVCFVAFNKSIAEELKRRVPPGCQAQTMHSLGYEACRKAFGRLDVNDWVTTDHLAAIVGKDARKLRQDEPVLLSAVTQLVGLCKKNLIGLGAKRGEAVDWNEELSALASHYDVDTNGVQGRVFELVPQVLHRCEAPAGRIDYDDMIWLPVWLDLPLYRYDLLLVDEAQDLNRCQQALAKKAGRRLILCGDDRQAIYGFAGADSQSMDRMAKELGAQVKTEPVDRKIAPDLTIAAGSTMTWQSNEIGAVMGPGAGWEGRGCVVLPLTVTRRCGKAIVEEARKIVPDFEAHEGNPEGRITTAAYKDQRGKPACETPNGQSIPGSYTELVADGDFILCRVNAPLVSQCFRFLKAGRKANIQGRDVGQGLTSTIRKLKAISVPDLVGKLDDWLSQETAKEQAKRNPSEARLIALQDRHDCLLAFAEGARTVEDVVAKIASVFTDDKTSPGIKLSSIHKAKGLEARRVFLLQIEGASVPHPMARSAWQRGQEMNLLYVATTRAIEELVYVS